MRAAACRPYCRPRSCGAPETSISGNGSAIVVSGCCNPWLLYPDRASKGKAMKAAVIHAPHDLRIDQFEIPAMAEHEVKVRVRHGGICGSDLHYFHQGGFGAIRIQHPMVLGHEVAGEVFEVGPAVTLVR